VRLQNSDIKRRRGMKKGNILLHGIGKILFCMIESVPIIGEMIVIGNIISKISIFDGFFCFGQCL
jgi:hypothetical protein